ncbi:hypothetical protein FIBSPDRAFT_877989 [Athelia psychrophila]|uniref:Uncharacterized protein n=1 Tax=Athelia psychrophila TaxID=1759441 RepID=A0A167VGI0_9AGAM|nr:hypothetical protein FIBSPDRAFT_877982 [Fibularhizoctonia sp. CBS 109695]KZP04989.1 hypothetical protein FIBSPDRAFT_877989 [Fibularhizoctonia sp. CBS 109695]
MTRLCCQISINTFLPALSQVNLAKKYETLRSPLPLISPLSSLLLRSRCTFLASLILASMFTQDRCYSNKAWAKLSDLSPHEIGCYTCLNWRCARLALVDRQST